MTLASQRISHRVSQHISMYSTRIHSTLKFYCFSSSCVLDTSHLQTLPPPFPYPLHEMISGRSSRNQNVPRSGRRLCCYRRGAQPGRLVPARRTQCRAEFRRVGGFERSRRERGVRADLSAGYFRDLLGHRGQRTCHHVCPYFEAVFLGKACQRRSLPIAFVGVNAGTL